VNFAKLPIHQRSRWAQDNEVWLAWARRVVARRSAELKLPMLTALTILLLKQRRDELEGQWA
jgi:hypothetical protein